MQWRKSSFCGTDHVTEQCVEIASAPSSGLVFVKASTREDVVVCTDEEFRAFLLGVKAGEFDDLT